MQKENLSMNDDLLQMKSDYDHLKTSMDKQAIINQQLMEMVFRNKANVLDSNKKTAMVSLGAAMFITLVVSYIRGIDMSLACMIAAFYVLVLVGYALIYSRLGKIEYSTDNVLSTVIRLRKFKRNYMIVNIVSWVLLLGLMCLVFPKIQDTFRIPEWGMAAIAVMCVAILAGISIQYFIDRKILRTCDDIINHLEDRS